MTVPEYCRKTYMTKNINKLYFNTIYDANRLKSIIYKNALGKLARESSASKSSNSPVDFYKMLQIVAGTNFPSMFL